jgi:hypothetical protein
VDTGRRHGFESDSQNIELNSANNYFAIVSPPFCRNAQALQRGPRIGPKLVKHEVRHHTFIYAPT